MKILLAPFGTRGDIQPLIALGLALRARGHCVEIAAPDDFGNWIESFGLVFHPAGINVKATLLGAGDSIRSLGWQVKHLHDELIPTQFQSLARTCPDADIIVGAGLQFAGPSVAELRRIPYVPVLYCPVVFPSSHHPAPFVKWQRLPQVLNLLSWLLGAVAADLVLRKSMNRGRKLLGLDPILSPSRRLVSGERVILAADRMVAPPPPKLPDNVAVTGALVLEDGDVLDDELLGFLDAGPPPVYVGFGSMVTADTERATGAALEAARLAGCRLILGSGWAGLGIGRADLPAWCRVVESTPHHLLFSRCAAIVHHGGAGTTTTAARAGVPQMIVPHLLDQFYWANRVQALRLGPPTLPFNRLTAARLAERIKAVFEDAVFGSRAATLSHEVSSRDGLAAAVKVVEQLAGPSRVW
jgi:UDP:flavonoid glycosyltransferase YjiC (YdhE family)